MRVKDNTRFQAFVQDLQESFWGDFQGRTREVLKQPLERDAEQQMAEYLGLKVARAGAAGGAGGLPQRLLGTGLRDVAGRAAYHQRDGTLLRGSPPPNTAHGRVHQRGQRGSDHVCDFQSP